MVRVLPDNHHGLMEEFQYSKKKSKICRGLSNPESEHPLGEMRLQFGDASLEFRLYLGSPLLEF